MKVAWLALFAVVSAGPAFAQPTVGPSTAPRPNNTLSYAPVVGASSTTTTMPAVAIGLTSAGTNCSGAADVMAGSYNTFTTVPASSGALLPVASVGTVIEVLNRGANTLVVCPRTGQSIESNAANSGVQLPAQSNAKYLLETSTEWRIVN